jgi:hypothetical protein
MTIQVHMKFTLDEIIGEYFGDPEVIKLFSLNPDIQFGSQSDNVYD